MINDNNKKLINNNIKKCSMTIIWADLAHHIHSKCPTGTIKLSHAMRQISPYEKLRNTIGKETYRYYTQWKIHYLSKSSGHPIYFKLYIILMT